MVISIYLGVVCLSAWLSSESTQPGFRSDYFFSRLTKPYAGNVLYYKICKKQ